MESSVTNVLQSTFTIDLPTGDEINNSYLSSEEAAEIELSQNELIAKAKNIKLKRIESVFLTTALEDGINQMLILSVCNQDWKTVPIKDDDSQKQNSITQDDNLEEIDSFDLARDSHKIAKMNSDRIYITETLIKTILDMKMNGTYVSLSIQLIDIAAKTYQSIVQKFKYNENRSKLKKLKSDLKRESKINQNTLINCDLQIHQLRDEINDEIWNCDIKRKYIEGFQNARKEQHLLKLEMIEADKKNILDETKVKIEKEIKINLGIEKFIKHVEENLWEKVRFWMKKYDKEAQYLTEEIEKMTEMKNTQKKKMDDLEKLVSTRQEEMDSWINLVAEREARRRNEELNFRSAVRLQSWWRGIMVRRRLAARKKKLKDAKRKSAKKKK